VFERLKEIKDSGTTIVIVSHSTSQIEQICDRSIWICDGVVKEEGKTKTVDDHYYQFMEDERLSRLNQEAIAERKEKKENIEKVNLPAFCSKHAVRNGGEDVFFENIILLNDENEEALVFNSGSNVHIKINVKSKLVECNANFTISISNRDGLVYYGTNLVAERGDVFKLRGDNEFSFTIKNLNLLSGKYYINVGLYTKQNELLDEIKLAKMFPDTLGL